MSSVTRTMSDGMHSGMTWPITMRVSEAPMTRAAAMKSLDRMVSVSARARRASGGQPVRPMAMMALSMPGPSAEVSASARIRRGNARKMSVTRISAASTQPPAYPAMAPISRPSGPVMIATSRMMRNATREPQTSRE
jgi:hypothetical protein